MARVALTLRAGGVPDGIRGPRHAGVVRAHAAEERSRPVAEVAGLPNDDVLGAPGGVIIADVPTAFPNTEVSGHDVELATVGAADDRGVSHTPGTDGGRQSRAAVADTGP